MIEWCTILCTFDRQHMRVSFFSPPWNWQQHWIKVTVRKWWIIISKCHFNIHLMLIIKFYSQQCRDFVFGPSWQYENGWYPTPSCGVSYSLTFMWSLWWRRSIQNQCSDPLLLPGMREQIKQRSQDWGSHQCQCDTSLTCPLSLMMWWNQQLTFRWPHFKWPSARTSIN